MGRLAALLVLLLTLPVSSQSPDWFATWQLDAARSSYSPGPAPYVRATRRIERLDNAIRIVEDLVQVRGGIVHLEWTGQFDGRDSRVHGVDLLVTYAYRQIDPLTLEGVIKVDGVVTSRSRESLSTDGKMLTIETIGEGPQAGLEVKAVYRRRD